MRNSGRLLLLLLALTLAGCASKGTREDLPKPPKPADYRAEVNFERAWRYGSLSLSGAPVALEPAPASGRVYVADRQGKVVALDVESGRPVWETRLQAELSAGPGVADGLVVVGGRRGEVIALDAADGELVWEASVSSEVLAPPRLGGGLVVIRSLDGRVFGFSATSGQRRWMHEQSLPTLTLRGMSTPIVMPGEGVIVGMDNGELVALTAAEGRQVWATPVAMPRGRSDLERMVDIDADPVLYRGDVYVVTYQGRLAAIAAANGRLQWQRELSAYAGLAVDATRVYVTDAEQRVWGFERFSGASVWRQDELSGLRLTGPAVVADYLLVGDHEGYLNWLSTRDGSLQLRQRIGGEFLAPPRVEGNEIYLFTRDGLTVLRGTP